MEDRTTKLYEEMVKFKEMVKLLEQGKKVKVFNLDYMAYSPKIMVTSDKSSDDMVLDCVGLHRKDTYVIETPLSEPEEVHVIGYDVVKYPIEYVYLENSGMRTMKAHLEGLSKEFDVPYNFSILDVEHFDGEYVEPVKKEWCTLILFERYGDNDSYRKYYTTEDFWYPEGIKLYDLSKYIMQNFTAYSDMDIYVQFPEYSKGYPMFIPAEQRKENRNG